jgi:hypothetical protein
MSSKNKTLTHTCTCTHAQLQAFIASTLVTHMVVAAAVCSPLSMETLLIVGMLLAASLGALLQPLDNFQSVQQGNNSALWRMALMMRGNNNNRGMTTMMLGLGGGDSSEDDEDTVVNQLLGRSGIMESLASQHTLLKAMLFVAAIIYIMLRIPLDPQACKSQLVLLMACLDAFMLFGHLWDKVPTLQVVLNCRLVYVCFMSLFNAAAFTSWKACMAVPFVAAAAAAQ